MILVDPREQSSSLSRALCYHAAKEKIYLREKDQAGNPPQVKRSQKQFLDRGGQVCRIISDDGGRHGERSGEV